MSRVTIAEYIAQDLSTRVGTNTLSVPLTLESLSLHYGVSLTPVRRALETLIERKVLRKLSNGRIEVGPDSQPSHESSRAETRLLKPRDPAHLEATLTSEVIQLGLRGQGLLLREEETASRLGVGRTIIRQVFNRLAGQGLIDHLPRRGWRVRTFDEHDLAAYLQVREALELAALELAKPFLMKDDLNRMLRGNARDPTDGGDRIDNTIHHYLVEKSGNRYVRAFFDGPGVYYTTLFDYAAVEARVAAAMAKQHREILRALIDEDWRRAREALSSHIREQLPIVRAVMTRLAP